MHTNHAADLATRLRSLPAAAICKARSDFKTHMALPLSSFADLDRATYWCETMWRNGGHGYRRRIDAEARLAMFEFEDGEVASSFNRRFGERDGG